MVGHAAGWLGVLAAAETPVWATIVVAAVSAGIGLFGGAAAAAIVNTGAERRERFRDRMIEAADEFVRQLAKAERPLTEVWNEEFVDLLVALSSKAEERDILFRTFAEQRGVALEGDLARDLSATIDSIDRRTHERLATAAKAISALKDAVARLEIVFRDPAVADCAEKLESSLRSWLDSIRRVLTPPDPAATSMPVAIRTRLETANQLRRDGVNQRRAAFLETAGSVLRMRDP